MYVEAIIPAAGIGSRMKSHIPKPLIKLAGKPILIHTLENLLQEKRIKKVIIAVNRDYLGRFRRALSGFSMKAPLELVPGGQCRRDSVSNALSALSQKADTVLIHDSVRPFITKELIRRLLEASRINTAVITAVKTVSTIKVVHTNKVLSTPDRKSLWEVQTPQVFKKEILLKAYKSFGRCCATDDASLVEKLGVRVSVINGLYANIKITTQLDLLCAEAVLNKGKRLWV